jgi:tetratricopeptide (TPR) repeat protein/tRNA A-37 threonylcarbamoyl transferase component Bud32
VDGETVYTPLPTGGAEPDATYFVGYARQTPSDDTTGLPPAALSQGAWPSADAPTVFSDPRPPGTAVVGNTAAVRAASGPLQVGQQFSARYIIVRVLGIGGMGAVYQAWDAELSVMVALKVVRPEVTRDPSAALEIERRFKQELLLARQVTHRNVVRIHDMGEIDGVKYITMPFIEGDDLSSVLRKAGQLPVATVMTIARQVASGLKAAHDAGVVHRDLKPANIMMEKDAEAIIMDFGIARTASHQRAAVAATARAAGMLSPAIQNQLTRATATVAGAVVGTVAYMAPEQARGEEVDQRVDIYAFGLILYDLLVGRGRVDDGGGAVADLQRRLEHAPPALRSIRSEIPEPLSRFVARCVEPVAAKRFASTADMVAELTRLDDRGKLRPVRKVVGLPVAVVVAAALLALTGGVYWYTRPPVQHDNVVAVIADIDNQTGDPAFDHTLEPVMKLALEDAGFITAYDRNGLRGLGVPARSTLDAAAARSLAVEQGLGVVISGSIERQANGYRIAITATRPVTGEQLTSVQARRNRKEQVPEAATGLMIQVRNALGDDESESAQQFAMASLSATSLDVLRLYAAAMEASSANKFDEALQHALKAIAIDPNFGLGYLIAANQSGNLGRSDDQRKYLELALQHLDGMTERERYHTRGSAYLATNDYQQCVKEYGDAIARYKADVPGRNQLAFCLSHLRRMPQAVDVMRQVVKILPGQPLFRDNLALYLNYASNFQEAEQQALAVKGKDAYATLALAFAQLGQGRRAEARQTYERLATIGRRGPSFSASGLGDMAALEGRFGDAVRILRAALATDLASGDVDSAQAKLTAIASAELSRNRPAAAMAAAAEALTLGADVRTRFLVARTFAEAGDAGRAQPLVDSLANELYDEPRAYAKIVEGVMALKRGEPRRAIIVLREANQLFDTWIGLFDLGRASLAANLFAQADSAFDACLNARRGEALSLFVDERPTYASLAEAHYYLGRARQELKSARYGESYREYLALRGASKEDPLLPDVRARAGL